MLSCLSKMDKHFTVSLTHLVADFGTDGADSGAIDKTAGVTVIPVLVGKLTLSQRKRAELVVQLLGILRKEGEMVRKL